MNRNVFLTSLSFSLSRCGNHSSVDLPLDVYINLLTRLAVGNALTIGRIDKSFFFFFFIIKFFPWAHVKDTCLKLVSKTAYSNDSKIIWRNWASRITFFLLSSSKDQSRSIKSMTTNQQIFKKGLLCAPILSQKILKEYLWYCGMIFFFFFFFKNCVPLWIFFSSNNFNVGPTSLVQSGFRRQILVIDMLTYTYIILIFGMLSFNICKHL